MSPRLAEPPRPARLAYDERARQSAHALERPARHHLHQRSAGLAAERVEIHVDAGQRAAAPPRTMTSQLSKPTTATSSGTARPISRKASTAPRAIWSLPQKSASGAPRRREKRSCAASRPKASDHRPGAAIALARFQPRLGERLAPSRFPQADRLEPLGPGDMGDLPAAERGEMTDGEPCAALVVRQKAERVLALDLREHVHHRQAARGRLDRARRSARRAVTTRPSTRLPRS